MVRWGGDGADMVLGWCKRWCIYMYGTRDGEKEMVQNWCKVVQD
jgi:hypothetical protein